MSPPPRVAAILAGGEGRRLGGLPKEAIDFEGEALGPRLLRLLRGSFEAVIVVTKRPELYSAGPLPGGGGGPRGAPVSPAPLLTADLIPGFGPLSGLHAALSLARERGLGEWLWLAACDMPRFDPRLSELLASRLAAAQAGAAREGRSPPLAALARYGEHFEPFQALYSTRLIETLEGLFAGGGAGFPKPGGARGAAALELPRAEDSGRGLGGARGAAAPASARAPDPGARAEGGEGRYGPGPGIAGPEARPAPETRRPSFKDLFRKEDILFVEEEAVRALSPDWGLFFNINRPEDLAALASVAKRVQGDPGPAPGQPG